jgi:hypothetical protein
MSTQFFPLEACEAQALEAQTAMAMSVVHLFANTLPAPDPTIPLTEYTANEADFSGYASETLTAWFTPIFAEGSGYMIQSPWVQFEFDDTPGTPTNVVSGLYVVDADGVIRLTVIFTEPIPMQVHGQGIGFNLTLLFPTNF